MKSHPLIFDWIKGEASRKDKLFSVIIVASLFALLMGGIDLNLPTPRTEPMAEGTLIRLVDRELATSLAREAEENGPFPGRLKPEGENPEMMFAPDGGGQGWWTDYQVKLRPMRDDSTVTRVNITPKGKREFPEIAASDARISNDTPKAAPSPSEPVLVPYDAAALEWLPDELPGLKLSVGAERATDALRFLVNLREDGSVAELIALAGAEDRTRDALENWLRGIRFKKGEGERWFGVRVDFVNSKHDGTEPE